MDKRLLDGGIRAPHKGVETYMDKVVWPAEPLGAYLATMVRIVVVLLGQHRDQ